MSDVMAIAASIIAADAKHAAEAALFARIETIPVSALVASDRVITYKRGGAPVVNVIAMLAHSPRGCIGNTHVELRGVKPVGCYAQCASIDVIRAEKPETD